tara:strand:+ start:643 stop:1416 length:774 start_codon:yes stop_codon:yes gene_type:complete
MKPIYLSAVVVAAGAVVSIASSGAENPAPRPEQQTQDPLAFIDIAAALEADSKIHHALAELEVQTLLSGGLEIKRAGIHLLGPSTEDDLSNTAQIFPGTTDHFVRDWGFWQCEAHYPMPYNKGDADFGLNSDAAWVSFRRMMTSRGFKAITRVDASGKYSVFALLSERGVRYLKSLIAPEDTSGALTTDWYGVDRPHADKPTPMTLVLVADNIAYLPFSVDLILEDLASTANTTYEIELASGLTPTVADDLVKRLGK